MTVVAKIEGNISSSQLMDRMTRCMADNEASLISERADREERSFNQTLREEQDRAYEESLKADQEKVGVIRYLLGLFHFHPPPKKIMDVRGK